MNRLRLRVACAGIFGLGVVAIGCPRPNDPEVAPPPAHVEAVIAPPPKPTQPSLSAVVSKPLRDRWATLAFAPDGTLIALGDHTVVTRTREGETKRAAFPRNALLRSAAGFSGVAIDQDDGVTLLATPSLDVLFKGEGHSLATSVVAIENDRVLLLQQGDKLLRLAIPKQADDAHIQDVALVANGTRINVSVVSGDERTLRALLFDAATGVLLGRGVPFEPITFNSMRGAFGHTVGFAIEKHRLFRINLEHGTVERDVTLACPPETSLSDPTLSPDERTLLVTCGADGIVLDASSLLERRRIPQILPGCDNIALGGTILHDNRTLVLSGCGGEAKIDLRAGKYICGDAPGLLGAAYARTLDPHPRVPPGRENTPRCSPEGAPEIREFGASGTYELVRGAQIEVRSKAKTITLEENAQEPVVSLDESAIAYLRGEHAVVRSLPDGAIVAALRINP